MTPEAGADRQARLEERAARVMAGTAEFAAPQDIAARVLAGIERRARVPWWQRRVMEWPALAQLAFALTGLATALLLLLGRPATPQELGSLLPQPAAVLRQPVAGLHATLDVLAVFHRLADTVAASLPDALWYGGIALCVAAYVALLALIVFGYRLLQAPADPR
ncbi:MAG TPA: hypothetical protein VMF03_03995 [Steroidobacteraceae bacterium]|nr:hypothetical protein [Steroidobacteraceae bacterium]